MMTGPDAGEQPTMIPSLSERTNLYGPCPSPAPHRSALMKHNRGSAMWQSRDVVSTILAMLNQTGEDGHANTFTYVI